MSRVFQALQRSGMMPEIAPIETGEVVPQQEFRAAADLLRELREEASGGSLTDTPILPCRLTSANRLAALNEHGDLGAEKFSILGTRLNRLQEVHSVKRLLITSSVKEEGKSLMAANIAISLARHKAKRVLLIEGDLRQPKLGSLFGVQDLNGISEQLTDSAPLTQNLYRFQDLSLWCLFAGRDCSRPLELLQSPRLPVLLNHFSDMFDWVIIDAPPVAAVADADLWSQLVDRVLIVVREGVTSKKVLRLTLNSIDPKLICGVILNEAKEAQSQYMYYYGTPHRRGGKRGKTK